MHLINELNSTWSMYRYIQFILTTYMVWVGWHQHHTPTWISLSLFSPGINHSPVTVHWALIHLDRRPLWAEQTSWWRLQLRSQAAHTWICLKGVRPALRILIHHLQQVADCRLGGRACPLSNTFSRDGQPDPLFPFLIKNSEIRRCAAHLWGAALNVLPLADWFCHHLPVWTGWLEESCKGWLSHSW